VLSPTLKITSRATIQQLSIAPIFLIPFGCLNKQQLLLCQHNAVYNCVRNVGLHFRLKKQQKMETFT